MRQTKLDLTLISTQNKELLRTNNHLSQKCGELEKNATELAEATKEINSMMIKSQANEETIQEQYANIEDKKGQIEKLNLECTVVVTEKAQTKKELDRIDGLYIKLQREFKE